MNKETDSNLQKLQEYLQSHREMSSLSLKIKFCTNQQQNLQIIKFIEQELCQLTHLTDLILTISKYSILTAEGYSILSRAIQNLSAIKRLSLTISSNCFLENEGLKILKETINKLPELVYLKLEMHESNYVTAEEAQEFLDSLAGNSKLTTLKLMFKGIKGSLTNEENIQFWRGLQSLINLQNLQICVQTYNYGFSDLVELFAHIAHLKELRKLDLTLQNEFFEDTLLLDELFSQIGKMIELRSLKIHYSNSEVILNDEQRKATLRNLSNLKLLEKLELNQLEKILLKDSFVEYANMIKNMKYLKALSWDTTNFLMESNQKICALGQSLLKLNNLLNLEIVLELGDDSFQKRFFSDLSVSFSQMHNLLSLTLEFKQKKISEIGCSLLEESFMHLQNLEEFDLNLLLPGNVQNVWLNSISKITNLKKLVITTNNSRDEEGTILFNSIVQLHKLEILYLGYYFQFPEGEDRIKKLQQLNDAFMKLRNLKSLQYGLDITFLDSQSQINMLKKCFENLYELEYLKLDIKTKLGNHGLQYESLIDNLANLRRIEISFGLGSPHLNILGSSATMIQNLEYCSITSLRMMDAEYFLQTFESLSQLKIKKLNLDVCLKNLGKQSDQFEAVCSKLTSLEKLTFTDRAHYNDNLMIYVNGIKQIKSLKSLKLSNQKSSMVQEDIQVFKQSIIDLKNLQKLSVKLNSVVLIDDKRDLLGLESLKSLGNFKHFQFDIGLSVIGDQTVIRKHIEVRSTFTLDSQAFKDHGINAEQTLTLTDTEQKSDVIQLKQQKLSSEDQQKNEDNLKIETIQQQNTSDLTINIPVDNSKQPTIVLNDFGFLNQKYLNNLHIKCKFDKENPVQLELLQPFRDLTNDSKLERLDITLDKLVLNEEQISYLSRNFKFLLNLQYFLFKINCSKDYYCLFFDSFSWLTNLHSLTFQAKISEGQAISFGNSLKSMKHLQICFLQLEEGSSFKQEGLCSILNGLKHPTRLKELTFEINTEEIIDGDHSIQISECFSNLKQLIVLNFFLFGNIQIDSISLRQFLTLISSQVHLTILELDFNETNLFNQEMLDELIRALNKSTNLNEKDISIYLDTSLPINISQDFATLYNMNPSSSELYINARYDDYIQCEQFKCNFTFKWKYINNLEISFLDYLNKDIIASITIVDIKALQFFTRFSVREIQLYFPSLEKDQDIDMICEFLPKMQNIFNLQMQITIDGGLDLEKSMKSISEILIKFKTLRALSMRISTEFEVPFEKLMVVLNTLKKIKHLQELNLNSENNEISDLLIPQMQRTILRLVVINSEKFWY